MISYKCEIKVVKIGKMFIFISNPYSPYYLFGVKRKQNVVLSDSTLPDLVLVQRSNTPFHSTRVDFRGATQAIKAKQRKEHNLPMVRITVKFMSISSATRRYQCH